MPKSRKRRKPSEVSPTFVASVREALPGVTLNLPSRSNGPKLSECLERLIFPTLPPDYTLEEVEKTLALAATGWNLAVMEDFGDQPLPPPDFSSLDPERAEALRALVNFFSGLKRTLYPQDRRLVVQYKAWQERGKIRLAAAHTPLKTSGKGNPA